MINKVDLEVGKLYYGFPVFLLGYKDEKYGYNFTTNSSSYTLGDMIVIGTGKQNAFKQIEFYKSFTVNLPTSDLMKEIEIGGFNSGADKFALSELTYSLSDKVDAPIIDRCSLTIECELANIVVFGSYVNMIGKIVGRKIEQELQADGNLIREKLQPVIYVGDDKMRSYRYLSQEVKDLGDFI